VSYWIQWSESWHVIIRKFIRNYPRLADIKIGFVTRRFSKTSSGLPEYLL